MRLARFCSLAAALSALAGLGCSGRELKVCDITQADCQQSIYYRMLSLRGDGYDPFGGLPPVTVISEDTFRQQLEQQAAAQQQQNGPDPWDKTLTLLHLEPPPSDAGSGASIEDEVTHVLAFYDPTKKTVTVVSHPNQTGDYAEEDAMETLAHELVHALQDGELDLQKSDFKSSDEYFAFNAKVEGDARFYEMLFVIDLLKLMGRTPHDPSYYIEQDLSAVYEQFADVGAPLFGAQYLCYPLGAKREATAYASGGNAAVRHAYGAAPQQTVGFLVGDDGRVPAASTSQPCTPPITADLPTKTAQADHFGALLFYAFLRGWGVDHPTAFSTAQSWTGDSVVVQANKDVTTTAVSWRIEFSARPPSSVADALGASGELTVKTGNQSLELTASDAPSPLTWPTSSCP